MPTQQQQIDWLIKQVHKLNDAGCGCEDCGEIPEIPEIKSNPFIPKLNLSWGWTHRDNADKDYFVRDGQIMDESEKEGGLVDVESDLLIVDIPDFESIAEYEPVLLIDRFRPRGRVKSGYTRKSGYKHETPYHADLNDRVVEIPLTEERNIVDIKPEGYFRVKDKYPLLKGLYQRYTYNFNDNNEGDGGINSDRAGVFIYLGVRLRLTIDGEVKETSLLHQIRVNFMYISEETYKIRYQYT